MACAVAQREIALCLRRYGRIGPSVRDPLVTTRSAPSCLYASPSMAGSTKDSGKPIKRAHSRGVKKRGFDGAACGTNCEYTM